MGHRPLAALFRIFHFQMLELQHFSDINLHRQTFQTLVFLDYFTRHGNQNTRSPPTRLFDAKANSVQADAVSIWPSSIICSVLVTPPLHAKLVHELGLAIE